MTELKKKKKKWLSMYITCFQYMVCGSRMMTIVLVHTWCAVPQMSCSPAVVSGQCCSDYLHTFIKEKQLLVLKNHSVRLLGSLLTERTMHVFPLMDPEQKQRDGRLCLLASACFFQTAFAFLSMYEVELSFMTAKPKSRNNSILAMRISLNLSSYPPSLSLPPSFLLSSLFLNILNIFIEY